MNAVRTHMNAGEQQRGRHPRLRIGGALLALLMASVVLTACQNAKVGARCSTTEFGQQGDWVLVCNNGHWERRKTKTDVAQLLTASLGSAPASGAGPAAGAGATSGSPAVGAAGAAPTAGQPANSAGHFATLAANATLPDGATCARQVRSAPEIRAENVAANHTPGVQKNLTEPYPLFNRVDGNFVGTTDEIIQWTACKWGIDEDIVRAQAAKESWWDQTAVGDFQSDATICVLGHGIGADGHAGQCPASGGLLSITYQYWKKAFPEAMSSTAYNLDYAYAWWRACYTGQITWLNTVERGVDYGAGDAWGCIGEWYSGRWHTSSAEGYISAVKDYLNQRIWATPNFIAHN